MVGLTWSGQTKKMPARLPNEKYLGLYFVTCTIFSTTIHYFSGLDNKFFLLNNGVVDISIPFFQKKKIGYFFLASYPFFFIPLGGRYDVHIKVVTRTSFSKIWPGREVVII